jgi:hypothetical protein
LFLLRNFGAFLYGKRFFFLLVELLLQPSTGTHARPITGAHG